MGGLSDYPTFNSIQITYTFDRNWRVLSSVTEEEYSVDMGVLHSDSCTAVTTETYSYDRGKVDISAYTDFFSRYEQKTDSEVTVPTTPTVPTEPITPSEPEVTEPKPTEPEPTEPEPTAPTASDYIFQALNTILTEAQVYDLQATIGETEIAGNVYLDIANREVRGEIEGTDVWYTDGLLYVAAGDLLLGVTPEKLTSLFAVNYEIGSGDLTSLMQNTDILTLMKELQSATLEESDDGVTVTASFTLSDTVLATEFYFDRTEDGDELRYISVKTTADGRAIAMTFTVTNDEPILALTEEQKAAALNADGAFEYAGDLIAMLEGKNLTVSGTLSLAVSGKEIAFDVIGSIDWNKGISVSLDLQTEIGGKTREIAFYYIDGEIAVVSGKVGVQLSVSEAESALETVKNFVKQWEATPIESEGTQKAAEVVLAFLEGIFEKAEINAGELAKSGLDALSKLIRNGFEFSSDGTAFVLKTTDWAIGETKIGFSVTMTAGKSVPALPENVQWITTGTFEKLVGYLTELKNVTSASEWNIGYTMSVFDNDEAYAAYDYLRYSVTGEAQFIKESGALYTALSVQSADGEENYYIKLIVYGGKAYLSVSFYQPTDENYDPLLLSGNVSELSSLLSAVGSFDAPSVSGILNTLAQIAEQEDWDISIGSLKVDETGVSLTVPSPLQSDDISLALSRDKDGNWSLVFGNVAYKEGTHARIDGEITLKTAACNIALPTEEYIDITSLDRLASALFTTVFNTNTTDRYFGGTIACSVGKYDLSFDVGANIVWENGGAKLNVSIGANSSLAVNSGRYLSYVTVDFNAGMVYMTRYQYEYYNVRSLSFRTYDSPVVTYRSMTTEEFSENAWAQIVYLTNMGDTVSSLLLSQVGSGIFDSSSETGAKKDAGSYLKAYTYNEEGDYFLLSLDGSLFASSLGDITLKITCSDGKIANVYGSLDMGATFSVDLNYENVTATDGNYTLTLRDLKETWQKENYTMTVMSGVTESASSVIGVANFVSAVTLQNGEEKSTLSVQYGAPMSELSELENTDTACFMGWFTEENGKGERVTAETIDSGFGGKTLYAYWEDLITVTLDAGEGEADATYLKVIPSALWQALQGVKVQREQYNFSGWTDKEGNFVTAENIADYAKDGVTLYAAYEKSLQVTLQSDIAFIVAEETGTSYTYYRKGEDAIPVATAEGYFFVGWFVNTDEGWAIVSDELLSAQGDAVTLWAVWVENDLSVTVTNASATTKKVLGATTYVWTIEGTYAGGFAEGKSREIATAVGYEETGEVWYRLSNDGESVRDTLNSGKSVSVSGGAFSKSSMTSLLNASYGGATVRITYVICGVTVTVEASGYKQK
jgi:hypothetical protein